MDIKPKMEQGKTTPHVENKWVRMMKRDWEREEGEALSLDPATGVGSIYDPEKQFADFLRKSEELGFQTEWDDQFWSADYEVPRVYFLGLQ